MSSGLASTWSCTFFTEIYYKLFRFSKVVGVVLSVIVIFLLVVVFCCTSCAFLQVVVLLSKLPCCQ